MRGFFRLTDYRALTILISVIFIGLDISSGSNSDTGICIIDSDKKKVWLYAVKRLKAKTKAFQIDTHPYEFVQQIESILIKHGLTHIEDPNNVVFIAEEYRPGMNKRAGWVVSWVQGFILSTIYHLTKQKVSIVNQAHWKKVLTRRRTMGKEFVEDSVLDRCDEHKFQIIQDMDSSDRSYQDALDAFGIAYYALKQYL